MSADELDLDALDDAVDLGRKERRGEGSHPPAPTTPRCEACGCPVGDDRLEPHPGVYYCPTLHRCDHNASARWINADIQAGIDAVIDEEGGRA